jgi:hypothetical protein
MPMNVVADHARIVAAINGFNDGYQNDYLLVRGLSKTYLETPTYVNSTHLALALSTALYRWGAGKRKAPSVQPLHTVQATLADPDVHALLVKFSALPIASLDLIGGVDRVVGGVNSIASRLSFDRDLNAALSQLSAGILVGNTNVTYPMKVLLLLTGFMPALDRQVRKGLGVAGFAGANVTRLLMPAGINTNESIMLTRLPFYMAECYRLNGALLRGAASASRYDWLANEPGRLFDILLFIKKGSELNGTYLRCKLMN